ncbi:reverse transcriptase [Phytophthora megakarya]|uniref:Reverse transcriptase n=1 Tax=Phytophthora megakarya TaxID=4795 RepID=A0A225WIS6_9STRA|nr:reverse transcriptase [Phytophthora megakarya]
MRRIAQAQDEELRWSNLKAILGDETTAMTYKEAREAWKWADNFVLSSQIFHGLPSAHTRVIQDNVLYYNVLYYTGVSRRKAVENPPEMSLRLVVPTTMIQEVLHNCHDSIEGGHHGVVRSYQRVKHDYYWIGLYADVEKHVKLCLDCSSLQGYSPGNVLAERPFQVVPMDFVIPLPRSRRGNTALLLWQCSFTGFVIAKAMSDTDTLTLAKVFEECIYRRFGAPSLIRHDRDPRFMSDVFQAFAELIKSRSMSTLSYHPQAIGQQEHSVKTVMQSVKVYVEDPLRQDWDAIAERLVFAINNTHDMTRKKTQFYLLQGWDDHTTLRAMTTSLKRGVVKQAEALAWRREINHQQQIALEMAMEYQATEKTRNVRIHNEKLSRKEQATIPKSANYDSSDDDSEPKSLFRPGSRVWLHMEGMKPGLVKTVKRDGEELAYELELPDKNGYRFYPVVHVSRLKAVNGRDLARDVGEDARLDFDEELLPEDSWERDEVAGEFEVEAIFDQQNANANQHGQTRWVGYESTTWESAPNLSCGALLYDYLRNKKSE